MASDDRQHNERKWFAHPADEANSTPLKAKSKPRDAGHGNTPTNHQRTTGTSLCPTRVPSVSILWPESVWILSKSWLKRV